VRGSLSANYYEVLGVSADASAEEVRDAYLAKTERLRLQRFVGAPTDVITAVKRASVAVEAAWHVLGEPDSRANYDRELVAKPSDHGESHVRRSAWRERHAEHVWTMEQKLGLPMTTVLGLRPPERISPGKPSREGLAVTPAPTYALGDSLASIANWLAPHGKVSRNVAVPSLFGLRAIDALYTAFKADLHIEFVRLTEHPTGDGIVVDQDPQAGTTVRRGSTVTVQAVYDVDSAAP
jgi:hypothetical protein